MYKAKNNNDFNVSNFADTEYVVAMVINFVNRNTVTLFTTVRLKKTVKHGFRPGKFGGQHKGKFVVFTSSFS